MLMPNIATYPPTGISPGNIDDPTRTMQVRTGVCVSESHTNTQDRLPKRRL